MEYAAVGFSFGSHHWLTDEHVTHGEPHRGNVFRTTEGWKVVDWDTALVAPAERDWWDLQGGRLGDPVLVDLYSLRWDLLEVACSVSECFEDHVDDRNTQGVVAEPRHVPRPARSSRHTAGVTARR